MSAVGEACPTVARAYQMDGGGTGKLDSETWCGTKPHKVILGRVW